MSSKNATKNTATAKTADAAKKTAYDFVREFLKNNATQSVMKKWESKETEFKTKTKVSRSKKNEDKDPNAPKKPMSGYLYYCKENRQKLKDEGIEPKDIIKRLAEDWKALSEKQKKPYMNKAEKDSERYKKEMEDYTPPEGMEVKKKKRTTNAYTFFIRDKEIKERVEKATKGQPVSQKTKMYGELWKKLTKEERAPYEKMAEKEKKKSKLMEEKEKEIEEEVEKEIGKDEEKKGKKDGKKEKKSKDEGKESKKEKTEDEQTSETEDEPKLKHKGKKKEKKTKKEEVSEEEAKDEHKPETDDEDDKPNDLSDNDEIDMGKVLQELEKYKETGKKFAKQQAARNSVKRSKKIKQEAAKLKKQKSK